MKHDPVISAETYAERCIAVLQVMLVWREKIQLALDSAKNSHTFDDICSMVMSQQVHMFEFDGCLVFMQHLTMPQFNTYHCFIAVGDMQAIKDAEVKMMANAKALGCKYISICGRVGWSRELKKGGWEHILSTLYKEVGQ